MLVSVMRQQTHKTITEAEILVCAVRGRCPHIREGSANSDLASLHQAHALPFHFWWNVLNLRRIANSIQLRTPLPSNKNLKYTQLNGIIQ